jgi:trimeric autotransporter adhesin
MRAVPTIKEKEMKAKLLSVAVALVALAAAPAPAIADSGGGSGGAGGFQAGLQSATTEQAAAGIAVSNQNAVNANVPVSIAGGNVNSGPSSANQTATSTATTDVSNKAKTDQDQTLKQDIGGSDCHAGCGGAGGFQAGVQTADTNQWAAGISKSDQNAVNANVPVSVAGGDVNAGPSSANQTATSTATTDVSNKAKTDQDQTLKQDIGGNDHCFAGCGGAGGFQLGVQKADTEQWALGVSKSDQNAVNANTPVSIAGGDVNSGPSSANQTATSTATTDVSNKAKTDQDQTLKQNIGSDGKDCHDRCDGKDGKDGKDGCHAGCGGAGGFQLGIQAASTEQWAFGIAKSDQNAVNSNAPHSVAGGNIYDGPSSANQTATSTATTDVSNKAKTDQNQWQWQRLG